eukprot:CAMPEP_0115345200 /NCGR_PEP_ID=MMETSP0270-20121206/93695_1 /TAXON_ID=71861 /ORGANISM="Scrippsiella trochoidea, Strain CCMP3099" /LENGTH=93 /DNA_ID=CAMNT_0002766989 /DNA_START=16 /DNA_END=294 /DNA_ORIENTATION=-
MAVQCALIAAFRPWRIMAMNLADLCSHLSLISLGFMLTWFVERDTSMDSIVQALSMVNSFLAILVCLIAGLYVVAVQKMKAFISRKASLAEEV